MRALFSGAEPAETQAASPAVGGWEGLPGWAKLGASTLLVGGVVAAIVLPGIGGGSLPKLQNQEPRPPSRITDYQPPPPPSGIQNAAMNMGTEGHHQSTQVRRLVPAPTPMALYAASETFHTTGQAAAADPSPQSQAAGVPA